MTTPPPVRIVDTLRRYHDLEFPDPYAWMRSDHWQDALRDPSCLETEIREHLEAENAYADSVLEPVADLRRRIESELRARLPEQDASVPLPDGPYEYYRRYPDGLHHPLYCRRRLGETAGEEEVLLDGNREAEGHEFFRVAATAHAPDHRWFAYTVDLTGSEYHRLRVRDLTTGETWDSGAEGLQGDVVWAGDSRTLFYTALDDNHRPSRVYRCDRQTARHDLVYTESDPAFYLDLGQSLSRRFIVIKGADHSETGELRLIDAQRPEAPPKLLFERESGVDYTLEERDGSLILLTNAQGAEDNKIVTAPVENPDPSRWRELVPHRPGILIRRMFVFRDYLVRLELAEAKPRIVIHAFADGNVRVLEIPDADPAHTLALVPGFEFESGALRFLYSSPRHPERTYDCDLRDAALTLRKEEVVPSGHLPGNYTVERLWVASHDGAEVPVTLLYHKEKPPQPNRPLLLYGYGAYGMAIPDGFSPHRFSLVDRGVIYAIAHVRGGSERGRRWYREGKLERKTNTFRDFLAVADHLVASGLTGAEHLVANGRSAGGMLMGVVANWRPELFRAVVAEVPFLDVLNTMSDDSLPLTPPEWSEWGNPVADREACRRLATYSPYDNVAPQDYPHVLATAGIADPRVTYWEPAKWVARLRANTTGDGKILLHTNTKAGHAGSAGRFGRLAELALVQAYILMVCGMADRS